MSPADHPTPWLAAALERLDVLLSEAVSAADRAFGPFDPFRGLHVDRAEVGRLLVREHGTPLLTNGTRAPAVTALADLFGLDAFDSDVVLLALAPELDLAYERLFAFLHDDVSRRRASVGLALDLLSAGPEDRVDARRHFAADAPLLRERVIALGDAPGSLLRRPIELDAQVVSLLLGVRGLDLRLGAGCRLERPRRDWADVPLPASVVEGVAALVQDGVRLYLRGPSGLGQRELAEAVASAADAPLLTAGEQADARLAAREALVHGAVLFAPGAPDPAALRAWPGTVVIATGTAAAPSGFVTAPLRLPGAALRGGCWDRELRAAGLSAPDELVEVLGARFRLTPEQIASAVTATCAEARWRRAAEPEAAVVGDFFAAARAQTGEELGALATPIRRVHGWDDLVLPDGALVQLLELRDRVAYRERVLVDWGFDGRLALGKGVTALFTGSSGTGKTMAAGVLANTLELDAYQINLAGIISPYVGETEQNLDRVFAAAESTNAILFFDEADALFGKRSEVRDSRDRYSNIEISYLLQRMEQFDGISILASNFHRNIDDAFLRRLDFTVHFPFPDAGERERIWTGIWPVATPLAADVDFAALSERFPLSGGSIRNAALAAAYVAAAGDRVVGQQQLLHGVRRELNKIGRDIADERPAIGVPS